MEKFVIIFLPLVVFWIISAPSSCGGFLPLCFDKELVSLFSAILFLIISLLIISIKSIQLRGKPEEETTKKK
jgi:hypothetical protein